MTKEEEKRQIAQRIVASLQKKGIKKLVFDFDGTLLNGHLVYGDQKIKKAITTFLSSQDQEVSEELKQEIQNLFADFTIFEEILKECKEKNIKVGIFSKSSQENIEKLITAAGLDLDYFSLGIHSSNKYFQAFKEKFGENFEKIAVIDDCEPGLLSALCKEGAFTYGAVHPRETTEELLKHSKFPMVDQHFFAYPDPKCGLSEAAWLQFEQNLQKFKSDKVADVSVGSADPLVQKPSMVEVFKRIFAKIPQNTTVKGRKYKASEEITTEASFQIQGGGDNFFILPHYSGVYTHALYGFGIMNGEVMECVTNGVPKKCTDPNKARAAFEDFIIRYLIEQKYPQEVQASENLDATKVYEVNYQGKNIQLKKVNDYWRFQENSKDINLAEIEAVFDAAQAQLKVVTLNPLPQKPNQVAQGSKSEDAHGVEKDKKSYYQRIEQIIQKSPKGEVFKKFKGSGSEGFQCKTDEDDQIIITQNGCYIEQSGYLLLQKDSQKLNDLEEKIKQEENRIELSKEVDSASERKHSLRDEEIDTGSWVPKPNEEKVKYFEAESFSSQGIPFQLSEPLTIKTLYKTNNNRKTLSSEMQKQVGKGTKIYKSENSSAEDSKSDFAIEATKKDLQNLLDDHETAKQQEFTKTLARKIGNAISEVTPTINEEKYASALIYMVCAIQNEGLQDDEKCKEFFRKFYYRNEDSLEEELKSARKFSRLFQKLCEEEGIRTGNPQAKNFVGMRTKRVPIEHLVEMVSFAFKVDEEEVSQSFKEIMSKVGIKTIPKTSLKIAHAKSVNGSEEELSL